MRTGRLVIVALLAVTVLIVSACAGDETGVSGSEPTSAASAGSTTPPSPATSAVPTVSSPDSTTAVEPEAPSEIGDPSFLIADPSGVTRLDLDGTRVSMVDDVAVDLAFGDGRGGVIYQGAASWPNPHPILYRPAGSMAAVPLVEPVATGEESGAATAIELRGVAGPEDDPVVLYTSLTYRCGPPWQSPDGLAELPVCDEPIHARHLESGAEEIVGHLGGWECAAQGPVTVAGGRVVGVTAYYFDDDVQSFHLDDPDACLVLELPQPRPPAGEEWTQSEAPGHWRLVALAPDGATIAYVESSSWQRPNGATTSTRVGTTWTSEPTEVAVAFVVVDLASGAELRRVDLTEWVDPTASLVWFDYDGTHAVVSTGVFDPADEATDPQRPLVIGLDGSVIEIPVAGTATIWR